MSAASWSTTPCRHSIRASTRSASASSIATERSGWSRLVGAGARLRDPSGGARSFPLSRHVDGDAAQGRRHRVVFGRRLRRRRWHRGPGAAGSSQRDLQAPGHPRQPSARRRVVRRCQARRMVLRAHFRRTGYRRPSRHSCCSAQSSANRSGLQRHDPDGPHHVPLLWRRLRRPRTAPQWQRSKSPAISSTPPTSASSARRAPRSAIPSGLDGRLLHPQIHGRQVGWDEALASVARGFNDAIQRHGPDAVAFYVSGQLLTEDYYVANKLMKGFIGSANIDTNSRLCMASAVAGHRRAFGGDLVPGCYEDLTRADLIVLTGSNTAWCHPVLFRRMVQEKERRPELKLVVIDPRRTATAEIADLHLPIRSGTDVLLFNGLLASLRQRGVTDDGFVTAHTSGATDALAAAEASAPDMHTVARVCGIDAGKIEEFYRLFAATERVVTAFSQGVNQSSAGTDKVNSIINCHLLTGRIGRPGMGPFSLTGPTQCHGRSRSRWHGQHARRAHGAWTIRSIARQVQEFWRSPRMASRPGLKAVDLFEAVHAGPDQSNLDHGDQSRGEPARCGSRPRGAPEVRFRRGIGLHRAYRYDSARPCAVARRRLGRERRHCHEFGAPHFAATSLCDLCPRKRDPTGGSWPRWRSGWGSSRHSTTTRRRRYSTSTRVCPATDNDGTRGFDIGGLAGLTSGGIRASSSRFSGLFPVGGTRGTQRLFEDGRFLHPDGRARFVPTRSSRARLRLPTRSSHLFSILAGSAISGTP